MRRNRLAELLKLLIDHARPWTHKETPNGPTFYGFRWSFIWRDKPAKSENLESPPTIPSIQTKKTND